MQYARTEVRVERIARSLAGSRVDLPVLAAEGLQHEDVVGIGVQSKPL